MTDNFFNSTFEYLKSLISKTKLRKPAPNTENLPISPIGSYEQVPHTDHPPTGTISNHPSDRTHQSPSDSTSDTPLPIANRSNVLEQGPTSCTDRYSNRSSFSTAQDNTVFSDQTELPRSMIVSCAPVSVADHHPANGSNVLAQGPTSGMDRYNY